MLGRAPGQSTIIAYTGLPCGNEKAAIELTVREGTVYYLITEVRPEGLGISAPLSTNLELTDDITGKEELATAKPPNIETE